MVTDSAVENELEQLKASVDFLVELCETSSPTGVCGTTLTAFHKSINLFLMSIYLLAAPLTILLNSYILQAEEGNFKKLSHQSADFILGKMISQFCYFKVDNIIFSNGKFANFSKLIVLCPYSYYDVSFGIRVENSLNISFSVHMSETS